VSNSFKLSPQDPNVSAQIALVHTNPSPRTLQLLQQQTRAVTRTVSAAVVSSTDVKLQTDIPVSHGADGAAGTNDNPEHEQREISTLGVRNPRDTDTYLEVKEPQDDHVSAPDAQLATKPETLEIVPRRRNRKTDRIRDGTQANDYDGDAAIIIYDTKHAFWYYIITVNAFDDYRNLTKEISRFAIESQKDLNQDRDEEEKFKWGESFI
jgi:hypothetical protein